MQRLILLATATIVVLAVGVLVLNWLLHRRRQRRAVEQALAVEAVLFETADIMDFAYYDLVDRGEAGFDESTPAPSHADPEDWFPFWEENER